MKNKLIIDYQTDDKLNKANQYQIRQGDSINRARALTIKFENMKNRASMSSHEENNKFTRRGSLSSGRSNESSKGTSRGSVSSGKSGSSGGRRRGSLSTGQISANSGGRRRGSLSTGQSSANSGGRRRGSITRKIDEDRRVTRRGSLPGNSSENNRTSRRGSISGQNEASTRRRRGSLGSSGDHYLVGTERRYIRLATQKFKEEKWEESADHYANLLKIQEERLGPEHPEVAGTKYRIALSFFKLRLHEQAMGLLVEGLEVLLKFDDQRCMLELASVLYLIALIEEEKGDIDSALFYVQETQKYEEKALGHKSNKSINKLTSLSSAHAASSRIVGGLVA